MTPHPSSFPKTPWACCTLLPGPTLAFPHLASAGKGEAGLRVPVLLERCPNLGLGLFGPAAPSRSQGLAGARWLP